MSTASKREMRCPNCGQKTSGIDPCEWCGSPLLKGSGARHLTSENLAAKVETRKKAQEALEAIFAEQRAQEEAKRKHSKRKGMEMP